MRCYHKSAGAAFTVLAIYIYTQAAHKNKICNTQVSKSGSECVSVNLNRKNFPEGRGGMPLDPLDMLGHLAL